LIPEDRRDRYHEQEVEHRNTEFFRPFRSQKKECEAEQDEDHGRSLEEVLGPDFCHDQLEQPSQGEEQSPQVGLGFDVFQLGLPVPDHEGRNGRDQVPVGKVVVHIPVVHQGLKKGEVEHDECSRQNAYLEK